MVSGDDLRVIRSSSKNILVYRRHSRVPRLPELIQPLEESSAIKTRCTHHAPARPQRGEQARDESVYVEQRHHVQAAIGLSQRQTRYDVFCRAAKIQMCERDYLTP